MPEISDAQFATLQRGQALLDKLWNDPKGGTAFKKRVKEIIPDAKIPELDIVDEATAPLVAALEEQKKANKSIADRLDNWEKSQKDSKEESELQSQLDSVRKTYGFTADGMDKLITRMKEKNNPDAEAAAAWVAAQERKAKPISSSNIGPSALNLYGTSTEDDTWAALNKNPEKWFDNEVATMLNEFADQEAA